MSRYSSVYLQLYILRVLDEHAHGDVWLQRALRILSERFDDGTISLPGENIMPGSWNEHGVRQ